MGVPLILSDVPDTTPYIQYVATSNQTIFPYPFPITQDSDLVVVVNGATLATDSGYTLTGQGNDTGGNVVFTLGQTVGTIVTLFRDIAIERISQIAQNSGFSSTVFNAEYNNIYLIMQQLEQSIAQCLQMPISNSPAPTTTLLPANYANKYLAFDSNGNPTPALLTSSGSITQAIIAGLLIPQTTAEAAAGVTPTNFQYQPYDIRRYGADPTGTSTSDSAMTQVLSVCSHSNGGTIRLPNGLYKFASQIALNQRTTVILQGDGGVTAGAEGATQMLYTGTASPWINMQSSVGVELRDIQLAHNNASFTGTYIKCGNDGVHSDPAWCAVRRCFFGAGINGVGNIHLDLDKCQQFTAEGCDFANGNPSISLNQSGSYCNDIRIRDNQFVNSYSAPIQGGGQAISVTGNVFEGLGAVSNTPAGAMSNTSTTQLIGAVIEANWLGDSGTASGTWLTLVGTGIQVVGNYISGNITASTALAFTGNGLSVVGNVFSTHLNGINFPAGSGQITVADNVLNSVTNPWVNPSNVTLGQLMFGPNFGFGAPTGHSGLSQANGYRVHPDGTIEQWGKISVTAGTPVAVTFSPVPPNSTLLNLMVSLDTPNTATNTVYSTSSSGTGFTANVNGTGSNTVWWRAITR